MQTVNKLLKQIEKLRDEMKMIVLYKGLSSPETIKISQELDDLLNKYDKLASMCDKHKKGK